MPPALPFGCCFLFGSGMGTKTWDWLKMLVHKWVIDLVSFRDAIKQITSITTERSR